MDKDSFETQFNEILAEYADFSQWSEAKDSGELAGIAASKKADDKKAIAQSNPLDLKGSDPLKQSFNIRPQVSPPVSGTVLDPSPVNFVKLRNLINGQFGTHLQSTGSNRNHAQTRIIMQTSGASSRNPYLVTFDQHILTPFVGSGQFNILERNLNDVIGGASQVTLATKSGFANGITTANGWSRLVKSNTVDKIYSVSFVPGTAGDGILSITAQALRQRPALTPHPIKEIV